MNNEYDKEQFDKIANLERDVAVIKTELVYLRQNQAEQNQQILNELRNLEKKICGNQKELSSSANTRAELCNERFKALENDTRKIWEKLSTIGIFIYIVVREVAPRLIDIVSP